MKKFKIFVEGKADQRFVHHYIEYLFAASLKCDKDNAPEDILSGDGWTKIKSRRKEGENIREDMRRNAAEGGVNLIIFDADTPKNGGGFSVRKSEIEAWKAKYSLNFELFLFPNNQDDGALEDLLEKIINPQNKPVFDCWQKFEDCLPTKTACTKNPLTIPAKKSKIYAYMEVLHGESRAEKDNVKDSNRDFKKAEHWDLNGAAIQPLKDFLRLHLAEEGGL
ncbi:MAG: hypothetical protein LBG47_04790 [Prevotellaceae bacterium]|jgi:hypothetical protein|nr:hypothetical protein [Prevotellaceae bacterium]